MFRCVSGSRIKIKYTEKYLDFTDTWHIVIFKIIAGAK